MRTVCKEYITGLPRLSEGSSRASAGDLGLIPDSSGFHVLRSTKLCATTTNPVLQSLGAPTSEPTAAAAAEVHKPWRPRSAAREATVMRSLLT